MKLRLFFVIAGFILIFLSLLSQAHSLPIVSLDSSLEQFELQPSSSYPFQLFLKVNSAKPLTLLVEAEDFASVSLDTSLTGLQNLQPLDNTLAYTAKIVVAKNTAKGFYPITVVVKDQASGLLLASKTIAVNVGEKAHSLYLTNTQGKNIIPRIENVQISSPQMLLSRNLSRSAEISFENTGSNTDFQAQIINDCQGVEIKALNPFFHSLEGKSTLYLSLKAGNDTPEQNCQAQVFLVDSGSNQSHHLGKLDIQVKAFYDLAVALPNESMSAVAGQDSGNYVLVQNLSAFEQEIFASSNADWLELEEKHFFLQPNETKRIGFKVKAKEAGVFQARLSFENPKANLVRHSFLEVKVQEGGLATIIPLNQAQLDLNIGGAGLLSALGAASYTVLGVLIVIALFVFLKGGEALQLMKEKWQGFSQKAAFVAEGKTFKPETETAFEKPEIVDATEAEKKVKALKEKKPLQAKPWEKEPSAKPLQAKPWEKEPSAKPLQAKPLDETRQTRINRNFEDF